MNYSAEQLATYLGVSKRCINYRATKEAWPFTERLGRGRARLFKLVDLPSYIRLALAARDCPVTPSSIIPSQEESMSQEEECKERLKPKERMEKALGLLDFLDSQAIEDVEDLADVVGIAVRAKLSGYQTRAFTQLLALRPVRF